MVMSSHYVPLVTLPSGGYLSRDDLGGRNPPLHCRRRVETILIFMLVALYYSCQSHPLEIRYDLIWADAIRPYNNQSHTREILTSLFVTWLHTRFDRVGKLSITGSPPSEPYVRFSRIRLSRKQVSHLRDWHNSLWALTSEKNPQLSKVLLG